MSQNEESFLDRMAGSIRSVFGASEPEAVKTISPEEKEALKRRLTEQLYGTEGLTDALTDEPAKKLLSWAAQQIDLVVEAAEPEEAADHLRRLVRHINRAIEKWPDRSEMERVESLLGLVDEGMQLQAMSQGGKDNG